MPAQNFETLSSQVDRMDTSSDFSALEAELKKRTETPPHKEIKTTYENCESKNKVAIARSIIGKAFDEAGVESLGDKGVKQLTGSGRRGLEKEQTDPEHKPQVFMKPVVKKDFWGREKFTDEVVVVVRLNNNEDADKNTVAWALVKQKDGVPQLKENDPGVFNVMSELDYNMACKDDNVLGKGLRGDIGIESYRLLYRPPGMKFMGEGLAGYWRRMDQEHRNNPERYRADRNVPELLANLQGSYEDLLQRAVAKNEAIHKKAQAEVESAQAQENQRHIALYGWVDDNFRAGRIPTHPDVYRNMVEEANKVLGLQSEEAQRLANEYLESVQAADKKKKEEQAAQLAASQRQPQQGNNPRYGGGGGGGQGRNRRR